MKQTIFKLHGESKKFFNKNELSEQYKIKNKAFLRDNLNIPDISEFQSVRHFTKLSNMNFGVDSGMYPLGSCTMKYNPRINEDIASLDSFLSLHPLQEKQQTQGALSVIYNLSEMLKDISGMPGITMLPAAGAHGESTGLKIIDEHHKDNGGFRKKIIVTDTAHGTNPASSTITGHKVVAVKSSDGILKYSDVENIIDEDTAALMVTNPNTLGFFESDMSKIADLLHKKGALLYCDGANTNAWMGKANLGDMGVDVLQYNLHKTFSTPHGGGGPGSGPVVVSKKLIPYLPIPEVIKEMDGSFSLKYDNPKTIGKIKSFFGNFSVILKAYAYLLSIGQTGVKRVAEISVLNANYIKTRLKYYYHLPYDSDNMHEVIFTDKYQQEYGVSTMDIAKRLLDYGIHPPTVYFPLVVKGALMIEPTETESLEELDNFCDIMIKIAKEAKENPELLHNAPVTTPVKRCDEALAARQPILKENLD